MVRNIIIRFAQQEDEATILSFESYLNKGRLNQCVLNNEIILASNDGTVVAYLRFQLFWTYLPYLALIKVHPHFQRQGLGTALLAFLENHLQSLGFSKLLSSSTANEFDPQTWHLKTGFKEAGFIFGINQNNIGEVFFIKEISQSTSVK